MFSYILVFLLICLNVLGANQLKYEQSFYLLQHKNNPVNWFAWNNKTFDKAKKENKLIFLSIGYSTCHWCHVMEEESFEDKEVATILNRSYISIKVDREEMPQVDKYYQHIYNLMHNKGGGWPLTLILTPEKKVFFSATYLLKDNLIQILKDIENIYRNDKAQITTITSQIDSLLKQNNIDNQNNNHIDVDLKILLKHFNNRLINSYDTKYSGFGKAPKFPKATTLQTILDISFINKNTQLFNMTLNTLKSMANGGIYDQIEGGFFRYSVDKRWQVPHFEKMLYTQAELLQVYSKAYLLTNDLFFKKVVEEIDTMVEHRFEFDNLLYSASDADSINFNNNKEEGFYYILDYEETFAFLKKKGYRLDEIKKILKYFNITNEFSKEYTVGNPFVTTVNTPKNIEKIKKDLKQLRDKRKYPFVDKKIQTAWNSLYISALFEASKINPHYAKKAIKLLDNLLSNLYKQNILYHQKIIGKPLKVKALFEDYSFLINSLIKAYETTLDKKYLHLASKFTQKTIDKFYKLNNWYLSDDDFNIKATIFDGAYKSSLSCMIDNLFKMALLTNNRSLYKQASQTLKQNLSTLKRYVTSTSFAISVFVGEKYPYRVLKSSKQNLLTNKHLINNLHNRYLLIKDVNQKDYLACTINSCFSYDKDIKNVLKDIKKF